MSTYQVAAAIHKDRHKTGGADPLAPADIGAATAAALTAEVSRATTAETTNATAIATETTRAQAAEAAAQGVALVQSLIFGS